MLELQISVGGDRILLDAILDGLHLRGNDGQHFDGDAIEFVETAPGAGLCETSEDVTHGLVIHLIGTVEHIARKCQRTGEILRGLGFAGTGGASGCSTKKQT